MNNPLVSIITPCYNGAHCVHRLFDSIIAQTYRPLEYILVNDGSTDDTLKVVDAYRAKFSEAGIQFICHTQENKGLSGAINAGLKFFTGEYFCWPDADDYLEPSSIEDRMNAFKDHPDVAVVSSDAYCRKSTDLENYTKLLAHNMKHKDDPNQFDWMINGESIFCCGCHLVKTSCFLDVNPQRHIYDCRRGQNWQLLLPLYYKYKRYYLDKPLYNYIDYPNSMSKDKPILDLIVKRYYEHLEILVETFRQIESVQNVILNKYVIKVKNDYAKYIMIAAINYKDKVLFSKTYFEKQKTIGVDLNDKILYLRSKIDSINSLYMFLKRVFKLI